MHLIEMRIVGVPGSVYLRFEYQVVGIIRRYSGLPGPRVTIRFLAPLVGTFLHRPLKVGYPKTDHFAGHSLLVAAIQPDLIVCVSASGNAARSDAPPACCDSASARRGGDRDFVNKHDVTMTCTAGYAATQGNG